MNFDDLQARQAAYDKCYAHDWSEWVKSHSDPRRDDKTIQDSRKAIKKSCGRAFQNPEAARLSQLVRDGSIEQLAAYLTTPGANINARPPFERPYESPEDKALLDYAAELNNVAVSTWLLDHGAKVDGAQKEGINVGFTALHRAASLDSFEVAQLLIARGANVNARRFGGVESPLYYAASGGHRRMVELLLQNGADVEPPRTAHARTALSTAAEAGHLDIVELLEAHGAGLNDDFALPAAAAGAGHADIVRHLLGRNQSQDAKDRALWFGVRAADSRTDTTSLDLVSMLIAAGANVNNGAPQTPLMAAKRAELRELLLAHGALDFDAKDVIDCERQSSGLLPPEPEAVKPNGTLSDRAYAMASNELDKAVFSQACKSHGTAGTLMWLRSHLRGGNYGDLLDPQFSVLRPEDGHIVIYQSAISVGSTPIGATVHEQLDARNRVYPQNQWPNYLFALLHYRKGAYRLIPLNYAPSDVSPSKDVPVRELSAAYDARADKYLLYIPRVDFTTSSWASWAPSWQHYYVWWLDPKTDDMRRTLLPPGPWVADAKLDVVLGRAFRNFSCGVDCYRHAEIERVDGGDIYVTVTGQSAAIRESLLGTYRLKSGESAWVKQ